MKEDKLDKEIAASLKKKLVEASVPYELGAWEGFQKKRAARKRRDIAYWASGIAASLLLVLVGLNAIDFSANENTGTKELHVAERAEQLPEEGLVETPVIEPEEIAENSSTETSIDQNDASVDQKSNVNSTDSKSITKAEKEQKSQPIPGDSKALASVPEPVEVASPAKTEKVNALPELQVVSNEKPVELLPKREIIQNPPLIAKSEDNRVLPEKSTEKTVVAEEEPVKPKAPLVPVELEKEKFVAENDFPIIPKDKTTVGLGMGVSPGFGSVQGENQMATASTIGVGMLLDIKLPGKLTLGSGIGVNYLSQNAEQESTVMAFGNTYPQTEKLEVRQMQVELPVFVKYPLTRNNSISVQAGFSNFYALNQTASQENTVERQLAFYSNDNALGSSSVSLRQQSVTENTSLESKSGKFYPFATLNFGVNLRVLETKGANYVIMPFYNYQVKQVSGYGDTFGLFGASFKMNFGGGKK